MSLIKQAGDFFKKENYAEAYILYKQAAELYGEKIVKYNLIVCERHLKETVTTPLTNNENNFESGTRIILDNSKKILPSKDERSFVNSYFDHVYVVNLKNKLSNKLKISQHLKVNNIHFECFEAISGYNGEALGKYEKYAKRKLGDFSHFTDYSEKEVKRGKPFIESPGAIGYIYTYLNILKDSKKNGYKRFLILEDDILLSENFEVNLEKFIDGIERNWKILQLGASQYGWDSVELKVAEQKRYYLPRRFDTCGSFASAFSSSIVDELIEVESTFESPFDLLPMGELYERYIGKCFVAYPNVVMPDVSDSSIREVRDQYEHGHKMKWNIDKYDYPLNRPSIAIIISDKNNLKYYSKFRNAADLPFDLRLFFPSVDGLRPLHNTELLEADKNKIITLKNYVLPEADYIATLGKNEILIEEDIVQFLEYKTGTTNQNRSVLHENIELLMFREKHQKQFVKGLVSVIIPTYKRAINLENALESVVDQDYFKIEVIVVSDNGENTKYNKETLKIVNSFKNRNKNCHVELIEHKYNRNGAAARNTGILNSSGEFICFLDDDDIYLPGRLSKSIEKLNKSKKQVGAVYCGFLGWNSEENDLNRYKQGDLTYEILTVDYMKFYLHTNTATYKREAIMSLNGFDETYRRHQDFELNLRFFEKYTVDVVKETLVELNPKPTEISNKVFNSDMLMLKEKYLTQFTYLIQKFAKNEQHQIYRIQQEEVVRYIKDKAEVMTMFKNRHTDIKTKILIQICEEK